MTANLFLLENSSMIQLAEMRHHDVECERSLHNGMIPAELA